jgi:hypothetical protein
MAQATTEEQYKQALQREVALAAETMRKSGHPQGAKMAALFQNIVAGDVSGLPPELQASAEKIKVLNAQGWQLVDTELTPAQIKQ